MQRHPIYDDPFRRRAAQPRREAAVNRFGAMEAEPQEPTLPRELWTEEQRRGEALLTGVRAVLWLTMVGSVVAVMVAFWRLFLAG